MRLLLLSFVILCVFIVSTTIGANNDQIVNFNYLIARTQLQLSTLLAFVFGAGFILSWLLCGILYLRSRLQLNLLRRKLNKLQHQYDDQCAANNKTRLLSSTASSALIKS